MFRQIEVNVHDPVNTLGSMVISQGKQAQEVVRCRVLTGLSRLPCSRLDVRLLAEIARRHHSATELPTGPALRSRAVARHLDRIERALGVAVASRSYHDIRLTTAGFHVLAAGRRFFAVVDLIFLTVVGARSVDEPAMLSIATSDLLVEDLVDDLACSSNMLLSVVHAEPEQTIGHFNAYRVDAVHTWWLSDPTTGKQRTVRAHAVLDEPLWVRLPIGHWLAGHTQVSLADLTNEPWVSEIGPHTEPMVVEVFRAAGLPAPARLHVASSASVVRGMVRCGDVISFSSLAMPPAPGLHASRSLAEHPSRVVGLVVDPTVVPDAVASDLALRLTRRYLARLAEQDPATLRHPQWARWQRKHVDRLCTADNTAAAPGTVVPRRAELDDLDVDAIFLLRTIAEQGSINRAARLLSISQPALTRKVHRLEQRLAARLLLCSPRGTTLTAAARRFLDGIAEVECEFRNALAIARRGYSMPQDLRLDVSRLPDRIGASPRPQPS